MICRSILSKHLVGAQNSILFVFWLWNQYMGRAWLVPDTFYKSLFSSSCTLHHAHQEVPPSLKYFLLLHWHTSPTSLTYFLLLHRCISSPFNPPPPLTYLLLLNWHTSSSLFDVPILLLRHSYSFIYIPRLFHWLTSPPSITYLLTFIHINLLLDW